MSDVGADVPEDKDCTEGDDDEHGWVPPWLMELHEVLEWEEAVKRAES